MWVRNRDGLSQRVRPVRTSCVEAPMSGNDRRVQERRRGDLSVRPDRRSAGERRTVDRRSDTRVAVELWMEEVSGQDVLFRRTGNLGLGGVYFDKAIPHAVGTTVTLRFALPEEQEMIVARGEVVSAAGTSDGLGMGVKFIAIEGQGEARIGHFIRSM